MKKTKDARNNAMLSGPTRRLLANMLRIGSSSTLSQLILVVGTPVLTRLYLPEHFGHMALFNSFLVFIAGAAGLRYDQAIVLQKHHEDATSFVSLCMVIGLLVCLLLLGALGLNRVFSQSPLQPIYLLLPFSAMCTVALSAFQQWGAHQQQYNHYALAQVVNALASLSVSVVLGRYTNLGEGGLILGLFAGLLLSVSILARGSGGLVFARSLFTRSRLHSALRAGRQHVEYPLYVMPTYLLQLSGSYSQSLILGYYFGMHEVGNFSVAFRFLVLPMSVIGLAIGEVFRSEFAQRVRNGIPTRGLFLKMLALMTVAGCAIYGVVYIHSPRLFPVLLGTEYVRTGVLAQNICIGSAAQFISQPFVGVLLALRRARLALVVQATAACFPLAGLILGGMAGNIELAALYFSAGALLGAALSISTVWYFIHHSTGAAKPQS